MERGGGAKGGKRKIETKNLYVSKKKKKQIEKGEKRQRGTFFFSPFFNNS